MLTTYQAPSRRRSSIDNNDHIIGTITIPPSTYRHTPIRLHCGCYEKAMPEPKLWLEVSPNPRASDAFTAKLQRIDRGDCYDLIYFFDNLGGPTYTVTVHSSDVLEVQRERRTERKTWV